ncbi:MAG TPA: 3-isopropylmalate dehydratase small subunit [Terriglobales bacterium]|jgi:3-isopropylmalate/(R)-2-methylmalate dehydratase small subunit|nr:3-isopropylmalate dehydratase small subunit [Terriglobales bacterium]
MQKFVRLDGVAAPLPLINVDTDKIIPAAYLKAIERRGIGKGLFAGMRYLPDGSENPEFVLNKPAYRNSKILIAGQNFGCGSSREHAPWALQDFGISCVIAPSFADIFYNNAFKNGMLLIRLPQQVVDRLMADAEKGANARFSIDLPSQTITTPDGERVSFEIDQYRKNCLLNGLDEVAITMRNEKSISSFEAAHFSNEPWLNPDSRM